jgi:hypothetical protein
VSQISPWLALTTPSPHHWFRKTVTVNEALAIEPQRVVALTVTL